MSRLSPDAAIRSKTGAGGVGIPSIERARRRSLGFVSTAWVWLLLASLLLALPAAAHANKARSPGAANRVQDEIRCLALNIYHEARGEPETGKIAVGHVVMNRVNDAEFPAKVCQVVAQGGERPLHRCQFSWWCDGRSDRPRNAKSWVESKDVARRVYLGLAKDPTRGALWYHAEYVEPSWNTAFRKGVKIGRHIFYARSEERGARREDAGRSAAVAGWPDDVGSTAVRSDTPGSAVHGAHGGTDLAALGRIMFIRLRAAPLAVW